MYGVCCRNAPKSSFAKQVLRACCSNIYTVLQGQCLASNNFGIASETFILDVISPNHQVRAEVSCIFVQISQEFRGHCFFWSEKK
jgi:hypothetical protein